LLSKYQKKEENMASGGKGFLGFIGFWSFIIGLILAVVAGLLWPANSTIIVVLVILGIIIGLLNITAKEFTLFLLATIALVVVGNVFAPLTALSLGEKLGNILGYIAILVAPAAIIAAIKALWAVGKPGD
jgi:hypothetical protein